jgi:excisionase family DNA binding protein
MNPLMDAREVAELLQCAERTVQDHAREGRLPAVKFGDGWMFPTEALLRAVNRIAEEDAAKRVQPAAPKAVRVAAPQPKRNRPNLSLLA